MPKANWGGGATGAVSGAAAGSAFGPVGTAAGAVIGGVSGLFSGGKKKKAKKRSTLDPQTQKLYDDYIAGIRGEGPLAGMYNFDAAGYNKVFDETIGKQAYRSFNENVIPGITGQFRSNNLMNSSYTGESLSRAGRDVQEGLNAQRSANIFQGQQQANTNKQNAIQNAFNTQTFAYERPQEQAPGAVDQILNKVAPDAGDWLANYIKDLKQTPGTPVPAPVK